jgi:nitroimidazol reductase NimA-like FMN-containing flavoprotein (pyridoxamine 5'-phosphate oxidase superfamily)
MTGELNESQIDALLSRQVVGRLACYDGRRPYVVPVSYVYYGRAIYGYTADGLKLRLLRAHPDVCFQVDEIDGLADWKSAVVWARFEELRGDAARTALERLSMRLRTLALGALMDASGRTFVTREGRCGVVYRLAAIEKTGRFEQST